MPIFDKLLMLRMYTHLCQLYPYFFKMLGLNFGWVTTYWDRKGQCIFMYTVPVQRLSVLSLIS